MHKIIAALLLALLLQSAPARADNAQRDPFRQTEAITNPYQYAQAIPASGGHGHRHGGQG